MGHVREPGPRGGLSDLDGLVGGGVVESPMLVEIREKAGENAPEFLHLDERESGGL